jgi:hypothetical protein
MSKLKHAVLLSLVSGFLASSLYAQEAAEKRYAPSPDYAEGVYFGDTHIHSSLSVDASLWGMNKGPEEIYRYARGGELTSFKGWKVKLNRPLDFAVVADHSDAYGFYNLIADGADFIVAEPRGRDGTSCSRTERARSLLTKSSRRLVSKTCHGTSTKKNSLNPVGEIRSRQPRRPMTREASPPSSVMSGVRIRMATTCIGS